MLRTLAVTAALAAPLPSQTVTVTGHEGLRRWHKISLTLTGPRSSETATPNPFLDYRMLVTFTHGASKLTYVVPGYFAADGNAGETSAAAGDKWRAHLSPDLTGKWSFSVSFRAGESVAISADPNAGSAVKGADGVTGSFTVRETDKTGRDHRAKDRGRLGYAGMHHLRFAGGPYFLKAGSDSPENLLAYADIDNTPDTGGRRKTWGPHLRDWRPGDPVWQKAKGKGLIGAINYLARERMNAMSFLTYSYNGDDRNVFPYANPADRLRLDCSKLDQWEVVFQHMDEKGIYLHFKTQETENDQDMDGGRLGAERTLYYRELIARYAHHLALNWNLGEENTNTDAQRKAFAQYFHDNDPYRHLVVVHTYPDRKSSVYTTLLGTSSKLTGASLQSQPATVFADTKTWRQKSEAAKKPWVVANDEQGPANTGIKPDKDDPEHDAARADVLWGHLMAGGAGIESYFGYRFAHSDLSCQDFRSRDVWWDQCRHALELFDHNHVPFWRMENRDELVSGGWCLAGQRQHVVYLRRGGTTTLDLSAATGVFEVRWFDPRNGGGLRSSDVTSVTGGGKRGLGSPPSAPKSDWAILVRPAGNAARIASYGLGCAGTDGLVPTLRSNGLPKLGTPGFGLRIDDGRSSSAAILFVGAHRASTPLPGGCTLFVGNILFGTSRSTDSRGFGAFGLAIPNVTSLLGVSLYATAAVADPNGVLLGIASVTNGLRIAIGS